MGNVVSIMCFSAELVLHFHGCLAISRIIGYLDGSSEEKQDKASGAPDRKEKPMPELRALERNIDYPGLLRSLAPLIISGLSACALPKLVWTMTTTMTTLIDKCRYRCDEELLRILDNANFSVVFGTKHELVQDALIDMCKVLILSFPTSLSTLRLSLLLVDTRLSVP
jgi:hypothetical protein